MSRPWLLLPIEIKAREFHAKVLQAAVAAERGFDVVLGEQNAMVRQLPWLPHGLYVDKSVSRTKIKPFTRARSLGNPTPCSLGWAQTRSSGARAT